MFVVYLNLNQMKNTTTYDARKEFIEFLREHNIVIEFCCNLDKREAWKARSLNSYLKKKEKRPREYISDAFTWINTTEGLRYWINLNSLWKHKLAMYNPFLRYKLGLWKEEAASIKHGPPKP